MSAPQTGQALVFTIRALLGKISVMPGQRRPTPPALATVEALLRGHGNQPVEADHKTDPLILNCFVEILREGNVYSGSVESIGLMRKGDPPQPMPMAKPVPPEEIVVVVKLRVCLVAPQKNPNRMVRCEPQDFHLPLEGSEVVINTGDPRGFRHRIITKQGILHLGFIE